MHQYKAPLRDMKFVLHELFAIAELWERLPSLSTRIDSDTGNAILDEAAKVTGQLISPLNRIGDEVGATWSDGVVSTPAGFKEAYAKYVEGGWVGLTGNPDFGGLGIPKTLAIQFEEMLYGANSSFALYSTLTSGACLALEAHGSPELKTVFLEPMYAGRWAGTMCLTEPQAGSDLSLIRTRAIAMPDGTYQITGTKIFITGGDHDLTENIIHLVLARLSGAPPGPKGLSLFVVPKFKLAMDGIIGGDNGVSCGSIEHKMGIKASATCVMNFDDASGFLLGEPNQGLSAMFTMMNYERLSIGVQGIGCADASYQSAVSYARERLQGRQQNVGVTRSSSSVPILSHADVRRMLLTMKSMTEGGRAFSVFVAQHLDITKYSDDEEERRLSESLVALLTPICKAFFTDTGLESCIHGMQIYGGHGYIREWGQEQLVRDVRIAQIYEGTNGIQALDLLRRKISADKGQTLYYFCELMKADPASRSSAFYSSLADAIQRLESSAGFLLAQETQEDLGAAAVDFLELCGYTIYAWLWAKISSIALRNHANEPDFYDGKIATAAFYFEKILPRILSLEASIYAGSRCLYEMKDEHF